MQWFDMVIIGVILLFLAFVLIRVWRKHKRGESGCGCSSAQCGGGCPSCESEKSGKVKKQV